MMLEIAGVLFVWCLINQAGVPVPVTPSLLAAGAMAPSGLHISGLLVVVVGAALCADMVWYSLGRWRGVQAMGALRRLLRIPDHAVARAQNLLVARSLAFIVTARFLPELNPVAAGLAGAVRLRFTRYLTAAAGSALIWAGTWIGVGHLAGGALDAMAGAVHLSCVVGTATVLGGRDERGHPDARLHAVRRRGPSADSLTALGHVDAPGSGARFRTTLRLRDQEVHLPAPASVRGTPAS